LKKVPSIIKKCLIFSSNFFYSICFKSTKKTLQNGHFNSSRKWPHIFYIIFEKSYDNFFGFSVETILKIFLISCLKIFKLIFMKSLAENIRNAYFHYIQICPRFVSSCWITLKLSKLISRPIHCVKFNKLKSCKKIFLAMC
jgi:hypothetical protein